MLPVKTMGAAVMTVLLAAPINDVRAEDHGPQVVVADFDYADTSGEVRDQRADHVRRVAAFSADLLTGLAKGRSVEMRRVPCGREECSVDSLGPDGLIAAAKASGARFLVYGGIHKASTLVEFLKVDMLDLHAEKVVASRLVTFRGDDDEAFRRAAGFVAEDLLHGLRLPPP